MRVAFFLSCVKVDRPVFLETILVVTVEVDAAALQRSKLGHIVTRPRGRCSTSHLVVEGFHRVWVRVRCHRSLFAFPLLQKRSVCTVTAQRGSFLGRTLFQEICPTQGNTAISDLSCRSLPRRGLTLRNNFVQEALDRRKLTLHLTIFSPSHQCCPHRHHH